VYTWNDFNRYLASVLLKQAEQAEQNQQGQDLMSLNKLGLQTALTSIGEAIRRWRSMEQLAIAEADHADQWLNAVRSSIGHAEMFQAEYRRQLELIEKDEQFRPH